MMPMLLTNAALSLSAIVITRSPRRESLRSVPCASLEALLGRLQRYVHLPLWRRDRTRAVGHQGQREAVLQPTVGPLDRLSTLNAATEPFAALTGLVVSALRTSVGENPGFHYLSNLPSAFIVASVFEDSSSLTICT